MLYSHSGCTIGGKRNDLYDTAHYHEMRKNPFISRSLRETGFGFSEANGLYCSLQVKLDKQAVWYNPIIHLFFASVLGQ